MAAGELTALAPTGDDSTMTEPTPSIATADAIGDLTVRELRRWIGTAICPIPSEADVTRRTHRDILVMDRETRIGEFALLTMRLALERLDRKVSDPWLLERLELFRNQGYR